MGLAQEAGRNLDRGRGRDVLHLRTPFTGGLGHYRLINILKFTGTRKRTSAIVGKLDDGDDRLFLLTGGADDVIHRRLKVTGEHLDSFASQGLRALAQVA